MVNRGDTGLSARQLEAQKCCGGSWKEGLEFPAITAKGEATGVLLLFYFCPLHLSPSAPLLWPEEAEVTNYKRNSNCYVVSY